VNNYGSDLIDVTQRAALHAVAPHLQNLEQQNAELQRRLAKEARHRLDQQVAAAVPDYQTIDRDPNWHRYLLELDPLSGRPRQQWLNDATASGDTNRVVAFFRGFEGQSDGTQAAPRAASGRSRATGSSSKPTYTNESIAQLYSAHRKGAYVGREAEWARIEADIFLAQQEGRIQVQPYLTK
jgi:hypothetical protein